jgi:YD repeat-containing protein
MTVNSTNDHEYEYDDIYQLTEVTYPDSSTVTYNYDEAGSRTSVVAGSTTNYSRNSLNQYSSVGATNFTYDNNGNLTYDGSHTYTYDCENRLTGCTSPTTYYKYDFAGRRVKKDLIFDRWYCYDGDQVNGILDIDGEQESVICVAAVGVPGLT